jgi:RNA polymerase sigma-70 factor (ECF subfamily)
MEVYPRSKYPSSILQKNKEHIARLLGRICAADDEKAFEEIFQVFYERLLNFCIVYVKDKAYAEEIVSNVLLKLWMKRKESQIRNLETYLFISVKNSSLNHLKQYSNLRLVYLEDAGVHDIMNLHDPGKELERRELIFKMNEAIEALPLQCKIIFKLVKEEGLKYKQVAEILEISPRTVETQLVRAMKKLDRILTPYIDSKQSPTKTNNSAFKSLNFFFSWIF